MPAGPGALEAGRLIGKVGLGSQRELALPGDAQDQAFAGDADVVVGDAFDGEGLQLRRVDSEADLDQRRG